MGKYNLDEVFYKKYFCKVLILEYEIYRPPFSSLEKQDESQNIETLFDLW